MGHMDTPEKRERALAGSMGNKASIKRIARQQKFLEFIAGGATIAAACEKMGMHRGTYQHWRNVHPSFRSEIDALRNGKPSTGAESFQGDFISFRKTYFGMDTYWHQREIVRAIERAKPGEIVLINCPPEMGKTTLLEDWANFKLAMDPNFRITLVSEGMGHARKILARVATRMSDARVAPDYVTRFGPFRVPSDRKPWSADFFRVWQADHDERDYSMEARGWRSAIAGTRTDLLLVDDIQSVSSLNMTEKMIEKFRQDMLTRPGREGRVVIVGTRVGQRDFYERVEEEGIVDKVVCLPAMKDGVSLCPELWPTTVLETRRKKVGEAVWWRNYMQSPQASMDATFTDQMIEDAWDLTRTTGQSSDEMVGKVCGLDPALAGGNALHVAAYNADQFQVLDIDSDRNLARVEAILEKVERLANQYHFEDLIVEANAYQKGLGEDERLKQLSKEYGFRIHTHQTGANKMDQALGVARMPISFINSKISLPGADEASRNRLLPLTNELRSWRADVPTRKLVQDNVMAMWFCWLWWQERVKRMSNRSTWTARGMPWQGATASQWQTNRGVMLTPGVR